MFSSYFFQSIDWDSVEWDKLSDGERMRLEHMRMHEKHRGHESMHAEMIAILFVTLIVSQVALVKWRQCYPYSYHVSHSLYVVLHTIGKEKLASSLALTDTSISSSLSLNIINK